MRRCGCNKFGDIVISIGHLINRELLKKCYEEMDKDKAVGIDGITKEEYEKNLEENLGNLGERLKKKSYKPQAAGRGKYKRIIERQDR